MYMPNLQMALVMSIQYSWYLSLDVICVQITAFSGNVVFRELIRSKVGDLINL